jgi:putative transposase
MRAVVSREVDHWFISITVEMPDDPKPAVPDGAPIGVDLGLTTFATLSTGEQIISPKPLKNAMRKLRRLGRWHSRKQPHSRNRAKAQMKLAREHRRVKNIRQDFLHKLSTRLAKNHSEICVEDLNVSGMMKNHSLARSISDAGWSEFRRQLEYKAAIYGSTVTVRDRWYASSKLCSGCGAKADSMPLSVREWTCTACGAIHDRDHNASKNLLKPTTAGYAERYASGDCGADEQSTVRETAVVERGTTTEAQCALTT